MIWSLSGQCLDVVLASIMLVRLVLLGLQRKYLALQVFVLFDGLQALVFIPFRVYQPFDYRIYYLTTGILEWFTTIWLVYALLAEILEELPGIKKFSFWFLNLVFAGWILVSVLTMRFEWSAYALGPDSQILKRLVVIFRILDRAFSLAEILIIISVLLFVLRYPIRVPRNLAAISAATSIFLCSRIVFLLALTYIPDSRTHTILGQIPTVVLSICLLYWIFTIDREGEERQVLLGIRWQSVPSDQIVHQLEALNSALLSARERA